MGRACGAIGKIAGILPAPGTFRATTGPSSPAGDARGGWRALLAPPRPSFAAHRLPTPPLTPTTHRKYQFNETSRAPRAGSSKPKPIEMICEFRSALQLRVQLRQRGSYGDAYQGAHAAPAARKGAYDILAA